jgi:hypothetical protein
MLSACDITSASSGPHRRCCLLDQGGRRSRLLEVDWEKLDDSTSSTKPCRKILRVVGSSFQVDPIVVRRLSQQLEMAGPA